VKIRFSRDEFLNLGCVGNAIAPRALGEGRSLHWLCNQLAKSVEVEKSSSASPRFSS
jgi:hypothetical protein